MGADRRTASRDVSSALPGRERPHPLTPSPLRWRGGGGEVRGEPTWTPTRASGCGPVINATCHWTIYGGSVMWPEVHRGDGRGARRLRGHARAARPASEVISRHTHAEASYVVSGCAAALQAGAAAILTGDDPVKMAAPAPHRRPDEARVHRPPLPAPPHGRRPRVRLPELRPGRRRAPAGRSWRSATTRHARGRSSRRRSRQRRPASTGPATAWSRASSLTRSSRSPTRAACRSWSTPPTRCRRPSTCTASSRWAPIWWRSPAARGCAARRAPAS